MSTNNYTYADMWQSMLYEPTSLKPEVAPFYRGELNREQLILTSRTFVKVATIHESHAVRFNLQALENCEPEDVIKLLDSFTRFTMEHYLSNPLCAFLSGGKPYVKGEGVVANDWWIEVSLLCHVPVPKGAYHVELPDSVDWTLLL